MKLNCHKQNLLLLLLLVSLSYSKNVLHRGFYSSGKNPYILSTTNLGKVSASVKNRPIKYEKILLFIDSSFDKRSCEQSGIVILNTTNTTAFVECPLPIVPYVKVIPGVIHCALPQCIIPQMDTTRILCAINEVHNAKPPTFAKGPFTGTNVLIGMIDTEFDTRHPAFLDSNNQTRFVAIWDQVDSTEKRKNRYGFGTIKNHSQLLIDTAFGSKGHLHGTMTAGAAAGSDFKSGYYGAAPGSKIIGVCYDNDNSLSVINGLQWIFSIADSLKLPCVINMSLGIASGPHDGTSEIDKTIDQLVGPGKIIVGAAGNDGDKRSHVLFSLAKNQIAGTWLTPYISKESDSSVNYAIDIWGESKKQFNVTTQLYNVSSNEFIEDTIAISTSLSLNYKPDTITWKGDSFIVTILSEHSSALNNKPHAMIIVTGKNPDICVGVKVSSSIATSIHAWNIYKLSLEKLGMDGYLEGDNTYSVNEIGGTAKNIIAVGSYLLRSDIKLWDGSILLGYEPDPLLSLSVFSGRGPTVDGRTKPDITAPGMRVFSSVSSYAEDWGQTVYWPNHPSLYDRYAPITGTSISSPIVAGVVALLLQANPLLTPDLARKALQASAFNDNFTGTITTPNNNWGAGKLNAFGALKQVLGITERINSRAILSKDNLFVIKNGAIITNDFSSVDKHLRILDLHGRVIKEYTNIFQKQCFLPATPGIYTVECLTGNKIVLSQKVVVVK